MSFKSQSNYRFVCDICADRFKTQIDLDAHLFNSYCEKELAKQEFFLTKSGYICSSCEMPIFYGEIGEYQDDKHYHMICLENSKTLT